jgi:nucleotide-binding universal stress UspA family protein
MSKQKEQKETPLFEHILVALDASPHSMAALEAAARLAHSMEAELEGLFVEDINWFHIGRHSMSSEVSEMTGNVRPLSEDNIERQVRALSKRMERALRRVSELASINYNFRTERGGVENELLEAAEEADLVTLGRVGQSLTRGTHLGKTAKAVLEKTDKPVLLLQHGLKLGDSIICVYDRTQNGRKALQMAKKLTQQLESKLQVIVFKEEQENPKQVIREVKKELGDLRLPTRVFAVEIPEAFHLARLVTSKNGGLLIANRSQQLFSGNALERILANIKCPILLTN